MTDFLSYAVGCCRVSKVVKWIVKWQWPGLGLFGSLDRKKKENAKQDD
jgi:hypothetical protein